MAQRYIIYLAGLTLLSVFLLSIAWEFYFEDLAEMFFGRHAEQEAAKDHWEYVLTATAFSAIALIVPILITYRNNAKHLEAEQALGEKQALLETTFENMAQGFAVFDKNYKLVAFNQKFVELSTFPNANIRIGMDREELVRAIAKSRKLDPREIEDFVKERMKSIQSQEEHTDEFRRPDGRVSLYSRKPMPDGGSVSTYTDITAQKKAEEAGLLAQAQAEKANRAKSDFLAAMSHELRTPLNAIIGFSDLIHQQIFGKIENDKYPEYAKNIKDSGEHLLELINDVLDLSKVEAGKLELSEEEIDVARVMRSSVSLTSKLAETSDVTVLCQIPGDLPYLFADPLKVKQIIINLLSNAVKFTEAGGEVTVGAEIDHNGGFIIQVRDTGIGIAPEDIPKALSPFMQVESTLDRKYEGTGLGLPLTKNLAELHGGSLDLQSEVGVGTLVTIRFPAERIVVADAAPDQRHGRTPTE